jgi:hypothetical protein
MNPTASAHYTQDWNAEVEHAYQNGGFALRNASVRPVKIVGEKLHFRYQGPLEATDAVRGNRATVQHAERTEVAIDAMLRQIYTIETEEDLDKMGVDALKLSAQSAAKGLGRKHDKIIIEELRKTTNFVGAFNQPFSLDLIMQAGEELQNNDVPDDDGMIFCALDSVAWNRCLGFKQFASADYVGPELPFLKSGSAKTWNGYHVFRMSNKILGSSRESTQGYGQFWHRSCIGAGTIREVTSTTMWENPLTAWSQNTRMNMGAKLLQEKGSVTMLFRHAKSDVVLTS